MENRLRHGFTTGSCAAAAAKAACYMLLTGNVKKNISIVTPAGVSFDAEIQEISMDGRGVRCAVRKDGGDDPDVTTGALVFAEVSYSENRIDPLSGADTVGRISGEGISGERPPGRVHIDGGEGIGRVTRPGLDQPVGAAAINSVPRDMITSEVAEVMELADYAGDLDVIISVPGGEEIAARTFNPRLGIEGGISIIGTTGIVEPMSRQALIDTIMVELRQKRAEGNDTAFVSPGNYGLEYMRDTYGLDLDRSVKCSNFIGETVDMVRQLGFRGMLLTGHAGKLVKIAGGIMNTHSGEADCRMEIIAAAALQEGASRENLMRVLDSLTTEEAYAHLFRAGIAEAVSRRIMKKILCHLDRRAGGSLEIECIMYSKGFGGLATSDGAPDMINANKSIWNL